MSFDLAGEQTQQRTGFGMLVGAVAGAVVSRKVRGMVVGAAVGYVIARLDKALFGDSTSSSTTTSGDATPTTNSDG